MGVKNGAGASPFRIFFFSSREDRFWGRALIDVGWEGLAHNFRPSLIQRLVWWRKGQHWPRVISPNSFKNDFPRPAAHTLDAVDVKWCRRHFLFYFFFAPYRGIVTSDPPRTVVPKVGWTRMTALLEVAIGSFVSCRFHRQWRKMKKCGWTRSWRKKKRNCSFVYLMIIISVVVDIGTGEKGFFWVFVTGVGVMQAHRSKNDGHTAITRLTI